MTTLFVIAQGIADGRVDFASLGGVPAELVALVRAELGSRAPDVELIPVCKLVLQAMAAQREVDLRAGDSHDAENGNANGAYDDCAFG